MEGKVGRQVDQDGEVVGEEEAFGEWLSCYSDFPNRLTCTLTDFKFSQVVHLPAQRLLGVNYTSAMLHSFQK